MSIASSNSTSSQVNLPAAAFKIYRHYKDKDDWDGDTFLDKTTHDWEIDDLAPPPYIVVVQGPPNVSNTDPSLPYFHTLTTNNAVVGWEVLLIKSLVKHFTMEHMNDIRGPITILTGDRRRRLQFVECPDDINCMIDAAKYADLVLLLVDASFGFEAETFEFVNLLRAHGFPPVMGVLTHLDEFKDETELDETKERLEDHFRTEIYQGAMISWLSGLEHDLYKMLEVEELARHILMFPFCLSSWRAAQPYVPVDRFEDVTPLEKIDKDANCDRNISLYGYLRGCNIKSGAKVHIAGLGDFHLAGVRSTADPLPLCSEMVKENDIVEPTHMENETFRTGTYLRLEVHDVPFMMVQNLDPCHPILVGGISLEEENFGHMQARHKRHNWHMKLLRSADPVTVSAGWRRYQTNPIYGWEFNDGWQMFDFSLEHGHCLALFYGPLAPPGTRIAVVQSDKDVFRIVAKVVVVDPKDQSKLMKESRQKVIPKRRTALIKFEDRHKLKIMKECKLKEILHKILKRTAPKRTAPKRTLPKRTLPKRTLPKRNAPKRTLPKRTAPKRTELEGSIRTQSGICGEVNKVKVPCDSYVPVNKDSLQKEDPAQRQLSLEQRRRVEIIDGEPSSYPCSSHFMLLYRRSQNRETAVVMSEKKRAELVKKQQIEELEKADKEYFSGGVRELVDL